MLINATFSHKSAVPRYLETMESKSTKPELNRREMMTVDTYNKYETLEFSPGIPTQHGTSVSWARYSSALVLWS